MEQKWMKAQKTKSVNGTAKGEGQLGEDAKKVVLEKGRKKAKGPNPLSVRKSKDQFKVKKRKREDAANGKEPKEAPESTEASGKKKRMRKRVRKRKSNAIEDATANAE